MCRRISKPGAGGGATKETWSLTHLKLKQQLIPEVLRGVQAKWQSLPCCHPSSHSDTPPPQACVLRGHLQRAE